MRDIISHILCGLGMFFITLGILSWIFGGLDNLLTLLALLLLVL